MRPAGRGWRVLPAMALTVAACAPRPGGVPAPAFADPGATDLFPQAEGWTGGDGCSTVALPGGRVLWLFSDSTIGRVESGRHAAGVRIVNNAVAVGAAGPAGRVGGVDGLDFHWSRGSPPRAAFSPADPEHWYWMAGGGLAERGILTAFAWEMGRAGRPGIWDFELRGNAVIVVSNPQDPPSVWRWDARPLFGPDGGAPGRRRSWGAAVLGEGAWSYIYGADTTDSKDKRLIVARAPAGKLADASAWEFRTGTGWSPRAAEAWAGEAGAVDEFSVHRLPGGGLVMVQMSPNLGSRVLVRTANRPEGPWSDGREVYACPEPAADPRLMVYTARGHPEVSGSEGLTVTYCVNSRDFGQAMTDATVYRPRFLVVPWALLAR